ncbi:MAG: hypothetical protein J6Y78_15735 [Paludibacteraceae bacterium]|nr:hypothetical protein [Paludibacteraceae bacterium]
MSLLDSLVKNEIALNIKESDSKDIAELSDEIDKIYPGISERFSSTYYYPTMKSFVAKHLENDICFYNTEANTWDGYSKTEYYLTRYSKNTICTAKEIMNDCKIKEINEEDLMSMFT